VLGLVRRGAAPSVLPYPACILSQVIGRSPLQISLKGAGYSDAAEGYRPMIEAAHLVHRLMPSGQSTIVLSIQALAACTVRGWLMLS